MITRLFFLPPLNLKIMDLSESKCQFFQKQVLVRRDGLKCNYSLFWSVNVSQNLLGAAWEEHVKNTARMNSRCSRGCKRARLAAAATVPAGLLIYESSSPWLCRRGCVTWITPESVTNSEIPGGRRVNRLPERGCCCADNASRSSNFPGRGFSGVASQQSRSQ